MARILKIAAIPEKSGFRQARKGASPETLPRDWGIVPFVAVTGRPTETAVRATVARVDAQGAGSFLVYARSGLEIEYMGEDWLRAVAWFCDEAARRGLRVWLYDEFNWPSGTCRGRVPAENEAWRYAELGVFPAPGGGWAWERATGPRGWTNVCEPDATRRFLELTHEVYAARLAPWFVDGTVAGFFTDEPGHPVRVAFPRGEPVARLRCWSGLEEDYEAATGRALRADVERWLDAGRPQDGPAAEVWPAYARLHGARFVASYFDPIREWCDAHGVLLAGHLINEHDPAGAVRLNGDPVRALRALSVPGIDEIYTRTDPAHAEWTTLGLLRQATHDRGGIAELFACGPCDLPPAKLLDMVRLVARHGATRFVTCMEAMDQRGLVEKHGFLAPTGSLHPWWERHARVFAEEVRRIVVEERRAAAARPVIAVPFPHRAAALAAYAGAPAPSLDSRLAALDPRRGRCGSTNSHSRTEPKPRRKPMDPPNGLPDRWTLALDAPNLLRVTFGADRRGAVNVREALRGVRIVLRDYAPSFAVTESGRPVDVGEEAGAGERVLRHDAEPYAFEMDGVPLSPARPCTALRAGFASLYRETGPIDLAPGVHRFRIARGAPDDNYFLPALLLAGDFLADGAALRPRPAGPVPFASLEELGLGGFVGTATWTARVRAPGGRTALRAETGGAPAEAFWNGASLGVRLRAPFEWTLPASAACAEGELSIAVSTSVAPMFGAPDAPGAAWDQPFWTPPRAPEARFGLLAAGFSPSA